MPRREHGVMDRRSLRARWSYLQEVMERNVTLWRLREVR